MNRRYITTQLFGILTACCWVIGSSGLAHAQNFANIKKADPTEADDEQILQELVSEEQARKLAMQSRPDPKKNYEGSSTYTLGPMDEIEIKVMRHPEVSGIYVINKEGNIQYEFVGDIPVSGLTKDEAIKLIKERLSEYIVNPEVSIKIVGYNSKVVYVVGEVYNPGKIYMKGDTITVREALLEAGLPMLSGVTKKSRLFTPSETGEVKVRYVDVYSLLYEGDLRENYEMKPGDVLYVPPTFMTKVMRAIQPVAQPVGTAAGAGRTVYGF